MFPLPLMGECHHERSPGLNPGVFGMQSQTPLRKRGKECRGGASAPPAPPHPPFYSLPPVVSLLAVSEVELSNHKGREELVPSPWIDSRSSLQVGED